MTTPPTLPQERRLLKLLWKFIILSVAVHILALLIFGGFVIIKRLTPDPVTFEAAPAIVRVEPKKREYHLRVEEEQQSNRPPIQKRLQSIQRANISLPEVPMNNEPVRTSNLSIPGIGEGIGEGFGFGGAGTGLAGAMPSAFGGRNVERGLVGVMYDLKQNRSGRPVSADYKQEIINLTKKGFTHQNLRQFFRAPVELRTYQFFIPTMDASEAPKAYEAEEFMRPTRWVALYTGRIFAPEEGQFRFVGFADDVIIVRIDNQTVFDGSIDLYDQAGRVAGEARDERIGPWFTMSGDRPYNIEVLIGEYPGGDFHVRLFVQKMLEDGSASPPHLFQVDEGPIPERLGDMKGMLFPVTGS